MERGWDRAAWLLLGGSVVSMVLLVRTPAPAQIFTGCCQCAVSGFEYCLEAQGASDCDDAGSHCSYVDGGVCEGSPGQELCVGNAPAVPPEPPSLPEPPALPVPPVVPPVDVDPCGGAAGGFVSFDCNLGILGAPDICEEELPKQLRRFIDKRLSKVRKAASRVEQQVDQNASSKKVRKQLKKMQKTLASIAKKAEKTSRKKNVNKRISLECLAMIETHVQTPLALVPALQ